MKDLVRYVQTQNNVSCSTSPDFCSQTCFDTKCSFIYIFRNTPTSEAVEDRCGWRAETTSYLAIITLSPPPTRVVQSFNNNNNNTQQTHHKTKTHTKECTGY